MLPLQSPSEAPLDGVRVASQKPLASVSNGKYSKLASKSLIELRKRYKMLVCQPRTSETRKQLRNMRDLERSLCAIERERQEWKQKTKRRREIIVAYERAMKNTFALDDDEDLVQSQVGVGTAAAATAAASAAVIAHSVHRSGNKVNSTLETVENAITTMSGGLDSVLTALRSFVQTVKSTFGCLWLIPVTVGAYGIVQLARSVPIIYDVVLGFIASALGEVWKYFSKFFTGIRSESGILDMTSYFATCAAVVLVPNKDPASIVGEISRRVGNFDRIQGGLASMFEKGLKYVEAAINALLSTFTNKRVDWSDPSDRLVREWARKVDDFEALCIRSNPDIKELRKAMALMQEGIGFRQLLKSAPTLNYVNKYLDRLTGSIQAHKGALNAASAFRMAPLTTMLGGGSGVGKTSVVKWLSAAVLLMTEAVEPDEVLNNMWQKGISEYWNGYVQQAVYVMDDCFQQKTDGKQLDNEAMFLIRAVGNWAFPLNFADLDSKGRFYFMSDMIMGTTNVCNIHDHVSSMVSEPAAVTRRIENGYWVYVREGWNKPGTTRLDYVKVNKTIKERRLALGDSFTAEELLATIPWEAWVIVPHAFESDKPMFVDNSFTLLDLAKKLTAEYKERTAAHEEEVEDLQAWANDLKGVLVKSQSGVRSYSVSPEIEPVGRHGTSWCTNTTMARDLEEVLEMEKLKTAAEEASEHLEQWTREASVRHDWIGTALSNVANWFEERGFPPAFAWVVNYVKRGDLLSVGLTEEQEEVHDICRGMAFAEDPRRANLIFNLNRLSIVYLLSKVMQLAFGVATALYKALIDPLLAMFPFFKVAQSESNTNPPTMSRSEIRMPIVKSQLGNPPADVTQDIAYKNTYKVYVCVGGEAREAFGQLLFIEGDLAVMPFHFIKHMNQCFGGDRDAELLLVSCDRPAFNVKMRIRDFLKLETLRVPDADVVFVKFARKMLKAHRSIVNLFLQESQMKQFLRNKANHVRLDVARQGREPTEIVRHTFVSNLCEYETAPIVTEDGGKYSYTVSYNAPTMVGDCGAPLCICEPRYWGGACIIGFHVAGKAGLLTRKGYSSILTRDMIHAARTDLGTWADNFVADLLDKGVGVEELSYEERTHLEQCGLIRGSHVPIGKVDKPISLGGDSKIKVSPIQEDKLFGECPTRPSHLRATYVDGKRVQPMAVAMEAYQSPLEFSKPSEFVDLAVVTEIAMKPHWEATKGYTRDVLTFEEAVAPPPSLKMKPLNRSTSPGYPYRLDGGSGKKEFFGSEGDFEFGSEACIKLKADVEAIIEKASNNVRSAVVYTDFPKDEVRPHAKVDAVATRAISGAPLDYVVVVRMYFGAFIAASFATHTTNAMAPGINPYTDWHELATKLLSKGDKVFAGDFKRFDASEQPDVLEAILDYINDWYARDGWTPELERDAQIRRVLWLDLIHSRHLTGVDGRLDKLVQWAKALPSGHPLTTLVNSMYALITLTACYVYLTKDYRDMWRKVQLVTYGDDNVNSVADDVAEIFNQVTVAKAMKEIFGLTYTSDKKDQDLVPYETIADVTFLKRSFREDHEWNGGWTAPLDKDSFLYIPYWFKNPRDPQGDLQSNIELMLGELCLYDKATWDRYHQPLSRWCDENGLEVAFRDRDTARAWMKERSDVWH